MMHRLRKQIIIGLVFVLLMSSTVAVYAYSSYSEVFRGAYNSTTRWSSPTRNSSGYSTWVTINSKWSEPRTTGTSPHVGVDIPLTNGTPIYAVMSGNLTKTNDTYNTLSQRYSYTYLYCHYEHMSSITKTGYAYTGDLLGYSGDVGASGAYHLHWGAYDENSITGRKSYRNETFYRNASAWNYGRDVDVYSQCQWLYNDTAKITAVFSGAGNTHNESPAEVRIYHRQAGGSNWIDGGSMTKSGFEYTYSFDSLYSSGTTIEWMVRIKRNIGLSKPYAWAPSKYYNPDANPNATSYRYAYFTNTVY